MREYFHPVDIISIVLILSALALLILKAEVALATSLLLSVGSYYLGLKTQIATPQGNRTTLTPKNE